MHVPRLPERKLSFLFTLAFGFLLPCLAAAQQHAPAKPTSQADSGPTQPDDEDAIAVSASSPDAAWTLLTTAAHNPKRPQVRIQALAALATLGSNQRAAGFLTDAMKDPDLDVRTAAILAAADTRNHSLIPAIRACLDDPEPEVVFTAASSLWKLHDRSGEDVLIEVADGGRKANGSLAHGAHHDMNRTLHDPAALTRLGVTGGASMLLGPFGFGITAIEYIRKNNGDSARAAAIALLAEDTSPDIRKELVDALDDKDPTVRAAAAGALGKLHDTSLAQPLGKLFSDSKLPVRLTAAAAYLNSMQPSGQSRAHGPARGKP